MCAGCSGASHRRPEVVIVPPARPLGPSGQQPAVSPFGYGHSPAQRAGSGSAAGRTIGGGDDQGARFAEAYAAEDVVLQTARTLAREVGLAGVSPAAGAVLRLLAAAGSAKAVVEIGTGTGVSGVWLLRGMRSGGVLTTIDVESEHQRIARRIFVEAGFVSSRTRIITGRALDVLPRLADGVYDLVFVDSDATEFGACADAALRLLRPGGVLVVNGALAGGRIADPAARDVDTLTIREMVRAVRESQEWIPAMIPSGAGLLAAVKR